MSDPKQPIGKKRETLLHDVLIPVEGWTPAEFRDAVGVHAEALRATFNADNKMAVQSYAKFLQRMVRDGRLHKAGRKYVRHHAGSPPCNLVGVSDGECSSQVPQIQVPPMLIGGTSFHTNVCAVEALSDHSPESNPQPPPPPALPPSPPRDRHSPVVHSAVSLVSPSAKKRSAAGSSSPASSPPDSAGGGGARSTVASSSVSLPDLKRVKGGGKRIKRAKKAKPIPSRASKCSRAVAAWPGGLAPRSVSKYALIVKR